MGVDYPLGEVAKSDPQRPIREALLRSAAKIDLPRSSIAVKGDNLSFDVAVTNSGTGHNVPTGFAFARQMWLEIAVSDPTSAIFASGVLATPSSDLCDAATLDEANNPMRPHMNGCERSDPQLVNFQKKLVNHFDIAKDKQGQPLRNEKNELKIVQAESGHEEFLQYLSSGVVERIRPSDRQALARSQARRNADVPLRAPLPVRRAPRSSSRLGCFSKLAPVHAARHGRAPAGERTAAPRTAHRRPSESSRWERSSRAWDRAELRDSARQFCYDERVNVPPGQPPWRSVPPTRTRPGTGFSKKKSGAGCAVVALGLFGFLCVVAGAVALVFFLKGRRGAVEGVTQPSPSSTAPARPTQSPTATQPTGSGRPVRPPVKRN